MKKYSKLIILCAIIVVTLSLFYIRVQTLTNSYAQFDINTIDGDESVIDSLIIKGDLFSSYISFESFKLTKDGIKYVRDESLFDQMEYYESEYIKALKKESRKFMRGKEVELSTFEERENMVYYAEIPYTRWGVREDFIRVETYNRETKKITKHQFDAPELLEYVYIEKIIPHDNQLYIAVLNIEYIPETDKESTELLIYTYDLANEQVSEPIKIEMAEGSGYSNFITVFPDDEMNPQELIVSGALLDYIEIEPGTNASAFEGEDLDYLEYFELGTIKKVSLETGEVSDIKLPDDKSIGVPVGFNGNEIVFVNSKTKELIYSVYNIATKEISQPLIVDLDIEYISLWEFESNIVKDNKVYTILNDEISHSAFLIVVDTDKVELAYKAKIEMTKPEQFGKSDVETYFHTLEIVE